MNFKYMPGLSWKYGYAMAVVLRLFSMADVFVVIFNIGDGYGISKQ
jgi:Mg2+ and Co2+ transporter CorA